MLSEVEFGDRLISYANHGKRFVCKNFPLFDDDEIDDILQDAMLGIWRSCRDWDIGEGIYIHRVRWACLKIIHDRAAKKRGQGVYTWSVERDEFVERIPTGGRRRPVEDEVIRREVYESYFTNRVRLLVDNGIYFRCDSGISRYNFRQGQGMAYSDKGSDNGSEITQGVKGLIVGV